MYFNHVGIPTYEAATGEIIFKEFKKIAIKPTKSNTNLMTEISACTVIHLLTRRKFLVQNYLIPNSRVCFSIQGC